MDFLLVTVELLVFVLTLIVHSMHISQAHLPKDIFPCHPQSVISYILFLQHGLFWDMVAYFVVLIVLLQIYPADGASGLINFLLKISNKLHHKSLSLCSFNSCLYTCVTLNFISKKELVSLFIIQPFGGDISIYKSLSACNLLFKMAAWLSGQGSVNPMQVLSESPL